MNANATLCALIIIITIIVMHYCWNDYSYVNYNYSGIMAIRT